MKVEMHGGRVLGPVYAGSMEAYNCHKGRRFKILQDLHPARDEDGDPRFPEFKIKLESGEVIEVFGEEIFADDPNYYAGLQSPINLELIRETRLKFKQEKFPNMDSLQKIASDFVTCWKS